MKLEIWLDSRHKLSITHELLVVHRTQTIPKLLYRSQFTGKSCQIFKVNVVKNCLWTSSNKRKQLLRAVLKWAWCGGPNPATMTHELQSFAGRLVAPELHPLQTEWPQKNSWWWVHADMRIWTPQHDFNGSKPHVAQRHKHWPVSDGFTPKNANVSK